MEGRVKHSVNNIVFGVIEQVVRILLTFITRTVFIRVLDDNLLGVNGLFTDILSLLSIAELGFGTAIIYGMYKPIAAKDEKKIAALMNYYKKIYNAIALFIAVVGLALVPFLGYLVNTDTQIDNLTLYYIIFLADSVCSYLLANRTAIIQADQNYHIIKRYNTCFIALKCILQVISLVVFKNFILYLLIQVFTTLGANVYGAYIAKKKYPYAFEKVELEKEEKKSLIENVKSLFVYKIGGVIMNHTDNILMSVIIGTINVGYYSNYNMIIYSIQRFINIIFDSIKASIGNLNAEDKREKKIEIFYNLDFIMSWLYSFIAIALFVLLNDFIKLWLGEKYIFNNFIVLSIVLNFYIPGMLNVVTTYRDTTGLFNQTKFVYLITAFINIILSIIFGIHWGIFGILIASSISRILTNFWFEPYILFKEYFKKSPKKYFISRIKNIFIIVVSICCISIISNSYENYISNDLISFIIKIVIVILVPNIIFLLTYRKRNEFKYFKNLLFKFIKKGCIENEK